MITVFIGNDRRELGAMSEGWIREQIERRRDDNVTVCVRVEIRCRLANMTLATPGCGGGGGGCRQANSVELRLLDLWEQARMNTAGFTAGNLISFLKRAEQMAC